MNESSSRPSAQRQVAQVVEALAKARKYRDIAPGVLERVARESLAVSKRPADAVKRAKTKLHQIHSAFVSERRLAEAEEWVARLADARGRGLDEDAKIREICAHVLEHHASTSERDVRGLYRDLFALTGPPASIVDLGCGLHPFALPWMELARDVEYRAVDLDLRMTRLVERLLRGLGQRGGVTAADLLGHGSLPGADVAFLMKLLPTLERQRHGAAARLLARVQARALVLSFPRRSLGNREKGMERRYAEFARELLKDHGGETRSLSTRDELFFVVTRR